MLFNSPEFFYYFAVVFTVYWMLPFRAQNLFLIGAGLFFYGAWDIRFLYLLIISTGVDYCAGGLLGPGVVKRGDRVLVSALLIVSSFLLVTVNWEAFKVLPEAALSSGSDMHYRVLARVGGYALRIDTERLFPTFNSWPWLVTIVTIVTVVLANLIYAYLQHLEKAHRQRVGLFLTLGINLGILGFFKYFNFFVENAILLASQFGIHLSDGFVHVVLPVGVSFYTFQSLSYTFDVYRKKIEPVSRLTDFAVFVTFFPPLVAGPIERAKHMLPQLLNPRTLNFDQLARGSYLILSGLFKKIAVADGLAVAVDSVYNSTGGASWLDIVAATTLFAFQIYCDFSGYTDIARGVAKFLGVDLMINFRLPYFSRGPSEFWQRWHISLSTWLRDYLYIPLGGNRQGSLQTYRNLLLTMLIGGLWHGAAWSFLLWGLYQGLILCASRLFSLEPTHGRDSEQRRSWLDPLWILLFFVVTCYGWLLFRANSLGQIARFTHLLVSGPYGFSLGMQKPTFAALLGLPILLVMEVLEYRAGTVRYYEKFPAPLRGALYATFLFLILLGSSNEPTQFIYFQF